MNLFDYGIVALYLGGMLWLGQRFKKSRAATDYFLGGRQFGWFSLCMSTMATQLSAISFISAPAFVGLRAGGGMHWLTYEISVPLAMIAVLVGIAPMLHKAGVVSVYEFLEQRYGPSSRVLLSSLFILSRSFGTGVGIYTIGLILSSILGIAFWQTMMVLGLVTIAYSLEGGMKAIVYSEVAQMIIKVLGIVLIFSTALHWLGGWGEFTAHLDRARLQVIDFGNFGFDGREYGFWPMLCGGLFLYASYYGTDQTQAQRLLSAKNEATVKKLLLFNGLLRFPVTLAYCLGGLVLGVFAMTNPAYGRLIPANKADLMIPVYISHYLPHGAVGIIVVALIAAWMSSYSSTLNSLTAVTMEDFLKKRVTIRPDRYVMVSKLITLGWGGLTMVFGLFANRIAATAIEAINKIGSLFYGPILAIFLLSAIRRVGVRSANTGVIVGVVVNLVCWRFFPNIFWFWWNAIGGTTTLLVAILASFLFPANPRTATAAASRRRAFPKLEIGLLAGYFALILSFCLLLPHLF